MNASEVWLTIILLTVATILTRCSFFLLGDSVKLPPKVQHALRYAPAAALAAIVIPDLVLVGSSPQIMGVNPKLWAGIGAAFFFVATRHLLGTIAAGMLFYTLLRVSL
jgi:branched-subunit amino acid transport protein